MKTLDQIREEVYQKKGYSMHKDIDIVVDEVAKIFAIEVAKEALINAANNARLSATRLELSTFQGTIDKESILSETNIPKL
ncbi:hypothetical protein [Sphingobacterium multivorum]|uniref:hypothetical protein n=1 Tax=Sphingobacterium multivorum TaxID=28454 RepID=UPI003DA3FFBE